MQIAYDIPIIGQSTEVTINTPDIPFPRFKTMLIAANKTHAEQLRAGYADPAFMAEREITNLAHGNPKVYVSYPGEILAGVRFSNIAIQSRVLAEIGRARNPDAAAMTVGDIVRLGEEAIMAEIDADTDEPTG